MIRWPDLWFPPLNLWNFREWRYDMSGGMEDTVMTERMELKRKLQSVAPFANHYRKVSPEPIEVIEGWGLGFNLGNAVKYIARCEHKESKTADLEKAIWYLQREVQKETSW